jgi:hypothetical protein|tara:strand:+ start:1833 stop:2192 length:360 start_codon:yes stop_codon:yes gene_type:complete
MSQCNNRPIKQGLPIHKELIDHLETGMVKFKVRKGSENFSVVGTLHENILPSMNSEYHRILDDQISNDFIVCWALNKNYSNRHQKESGWISISLDKIITTDYIGDIDLGEDYDTVPFAY